MSNFNLTESLKSNTNLQFVNKSEVENTLDRFGMNWTVEKRPLQFLEGIDAYETDFFGVIRSDNKECFGAFTKQYETFQNSELAELVLNVADVIGKPVTHGKMFKGGRRVALQLELEPIKVGNDSIKRYATAINSHDGSTSLRWGTTGITVSCDNQFSALRKELQSSARHTANMRQMIDRSLRTLEKLEEADTNLYELFSKMNDIKVDTSFSMKVVEKIAKVDTKLSLTQALKKGYSTRAINNSAKLIRSIAEETSYKGQTLWGLFSGVTHYTTHKGGTDKSREESKLTGNLQRVDQSIFDKFSSIVKAKEQYRVNGLVSADNMLGRVFA